VATTAAKPTSKIRSDSGGSASSLALLVQAPAPPADWQAKCQKLERLLQDKEEQLKAVTNNKTIYHTALESALEKTKQELSETKLAHAAKEQKMTCELEDLLRWKSSQEAKEIRERLASDGARLGRIVCSKVGMRAIESWEEGYTTKDLEQRKSVLNKKKEALQTRKDQQSLESLSKLHAQEARESLQMHLQNTSSQLRELQQEEVSLNDEKGAYIRALKRVASEDASRFRTRPKVCID
jgi:tousled-like kinase